jgi:hypothetical protein
LQLEGVLRRERSAKPVSNSSLREDVLATGGSDTHEETSDEPGNSYPPNEEDLEFGEPGAMDLVSSTTLPHGRILDELVSHSSLEDVQATGGSDARERKHKSTKSSLIGKLLTNCFRTPL